MKDFKFGKNTYGPIAENAGELSSKQRRKVALILSKGEDHTLAGLKVLHVLLDMNLLRFFMIPLDVKHRILPHVEWVFDAPEFKRS
jgi:hypothetical protein